MIIKLLINMLNKIERISFKNFYSTNETTLARNLEQSLFIHIQNYLFFKKRRKQEFKKIECPQNRNLFLFLNQLS